MYVNSHFKVHPATSLAFAAARGFGLVIAADGGRPVASPEGVIQMAAKLTSPVITHSWFALDDVKDDAGLLIAKMFYLGCAAKQEANRRFVAVHLVGPFEGNPSMAVRWRGPNGLLKYGG